MAGSSSRVTIHMVASLDGFIARRDGSVDWLETADHFEGGERMTPELVTSFLETIDCYVMGSRTYETARRFEASGLGWAYGDKPTFVVDHITRMRDDLAPDWPQPHITMEPKDLGYGLASGRGLYRVEIEGSPSMRCEFEMADDHDHDLGARMAGASRMVNAIPAVCAAPPGLLSALDLPLITGAGLVRPVPGPSPDSRLF